MTRVLPVPNIFVGPSSQFYTKTVKHEQVHVDQWGPGRVVGDLYIPTELFNQVKDFIGTSQADLRAQYNRALDAYSVAQVDIFASRKKPIEHEAFVVSDPIPPKYMVQNCGRW